MFLYNTTRFTTSIHWQNHFLGEVVTPRHLLESKASPSAADYDGRTPLHVACSHKSAEAPCLAFSNYSSNVGPNDFKRAGFLLILDVFF